MKHYEKYKPSGISWIKDIPEHWNVKRLKYLTKNLDGKRIPLSSDERSTKKGEFPYYGATGIIDYIDDYIFDGEYILIGEDGAPFFERNKDVAFVAKGKFWVNNHAHILETVNGYNPQIIKHLLNIVDYREYISGSTRDKLTQSELNEINLIDIPFDEQTAIANYLDHKTAQIDQLIEKKQKLIELLNEEKTTLINQAVTKGLNPDVPTKNSRIEWLGDIPAHWEMLKLKYIALLKSGESINSDSISESGEYPVYGGNGLRGFTSDYTHDGYYPLIGRQGALCGNINYAKGKFWASEHAVVISPFKDVDTFWLGELLRTMNLNQYSVSAAQPGLSVETIKNLIIPSPPKEEQAAITIYLNKELQNIDKLINREEISTKLLQEYRTALISEVVTGKIDVRDEVIP